MTASPQPIDELQESNDQFRHAWTAFVSPMKGAILTELPGLYAIWANTVLPVYNALLLSSPVTDAADLNARIQTAVTFMKSQPHAGLFFICSDWVPAELRDGIGDLCTQAGLQPALPITGMAAAQIPPAAGPATNLEFRKIGDEETCRAVSDINCIAYGFPLEWGRDTIAKEEYWQDEHYGFAGYADGQPVTTAATIPIDGRLYVALVATLPDHQRRGYAEAILRHSLAEAARATGVQRTTLHATPSGLPLYQRLGYRPVARFTGYTLPHAG